MNDSLSSDLASLKIDRQVRPGRPRWPRYLIMLGVVGAIVVAAVYGWGEVEGWVFKTEVEVTEIHQISPAQESRELVSTGYVRPLVRSKVGSRVVGRVARVPVREGQVVAAGEVLVELDRADAESALAAARAKVLAARANIATARASQLEIQQQVNRQRSLVERGAAARATLEDLEMRMASLEASVDAAQAAARAAQAEVEVLRVGVEQTTITAPIAGTIVTEPVRPGEMVNPAGFPVMEIADLASLVVETDVPEARLHLVRVGQPCEVVLDAFPGRRFRGSTREIGRQVDRSKATVIVRVGFVDPTEGVLPDMAARVSFLAEALSAEALDAPDRTVVPSSALVEREGRRVVFVLENGKVSIVEVRIGEAAGSGYVLLDGPAPGTRVVANPAPTLQDGQRVQESE